ncbi:MAG: hypothetical protein WCY80_02820 [Candidatus Izemoplasmatales bacterium]
MIVFWAFLMVLGGAWAIGRASHISGLELEDVDNLFINESGIELITDSEAPASFKTADGGTVERDFDLGMKGVLLKATNPGSSIDLARQFSGSFEMTFRAYSETSHYDASGEDWRSTSTAMTPYADLKEVAFDFTDSEGSSFTVLITAGERWNTITPAARVRIFGSEIGYHYLGDSTVESQTALKNSGGYYTRIGGATFANVARRETLTSANSVPVTFGYNAETMEIYVLHYGTSSVKDAEYRVVLDLDDPSMGLRKLNEFKDYSVSIRMNQIASGQEANMIIYDINGQSLDGVEFENNIGPKLTYNVNRKILINEPFVITPPKAFDLLEGTIPFSGNLRVVDKDGIGVDVYDASGNVITDNSYSENAYFIPNQPGSYNILLQGKDGEGLLSDEKTYTVQVVEEFIDSKYTLDGNYMGLVESGTIGLNSNFTIYPALVDSAMHLSSESLIANVTLLRNESVYKEIDNLSLTESTDIILSDTGNYQLIYSTPDFAESGNTYTIDFTVDSLVPVFTLTNGIANMQPQNAIISLPNAKAVLGAESKTASKFLYGPDGSRVDINSNNQATLTDIGIYKVVYMVNLGQTYTYNHYFEVGYSTDNVFTTPSRTGLIESNANSGDLFPEKLEGIKLTGNQENDTFIYQTTLDLSQNTKTDSLIEMMVLPSKIGSLDFWQFTIKLTDIHNPKNAVNIIVFKGSWGNEWSYIRAGANNQMPSGWENGVVLTAYNTGTPVGFSFTGESTLNAETLRLYYDNFEKAIYVDNIKRPGYSYGNQVIDLDSVDCFKENLLWEGFTTGEVEMSISVQTLQSSSANLLIKSVNGVDLAGKWLIDDEAPQIFTDLGSYKEDALPKGEVDNPYPIFPVKAYDKIDGIIDYRIRVFKDYQTANQVEYLMEEGTFIPDSPGNYSIVYSSTDSAGNSGSKSILITVEESLSELDYLFDDVLTTDVFVGTSFNLPEGTALGGSGLKDVNIKITSPSENEVALIDNRFDVLEAGTYDLEIIIVDYLGTKKTITYAIEATYSPSPIVEDIHIRPVFISGITYLLPDFEAYDYYTNPGVKQEAIKKIEVSVDGITTEIINREFTPEVSANGEEITITYSAKAIGSNETTIKTFTANVVVVNDTLDTIDLSRFFYQKDIVSVNKTASYIDYYIQENSELTFANPLIANQLRFEFTVPENYNNFSGVVITLIDSENSDIAVDIRIEKHPSNSSTTSYLSINGGEKLEVSGSFYEVTSYAFNLQYNATSKYLVDLNGNHLLDKIRETNAGRPFTGFASGKVFLKYSFEGVSGDSAIRVVTIGNQVFSDDTLDRIRPQVELKSFLYKVGEINQPFTAPGAYAADVLDPFVSMTLTIRNSQGIVYEGPIDEDYVFNPTEYGMYRFIYSAVDSSNRKLETTYLVTVKDRIPPVITLPEEPVTQGQVNVEIALPEATVTDNFDENVRLWVFVSEPNGELRALEEGVFTFTPTLTGEYTITYYAQDSYNAYVYHQYKIIVN